jgi:uncharacterized membrane protein
MGKEELEALWSKSSSWKLGMVYYCKEDPRAIVPRRHRWLGWTINCAHAYSWMTLLILLAGKRGQGKRGKIRKF